MLLQAAHLLADGAGPDEGDAAAGGAAVRECARAWARSVRALPGLAALRAQLRDEGFALLPPAPAGLALAAAVRRAARPAAASEAAAAAALEPSADGARVQGRARLWEAQLRGVPRAMLRVVGALQPRAADDPRAADGPDLADEPASAGEPASAPLRASLVQPFLALPGAPGQAWHRDCRGAGGFSVFFNLCDVPADSATLLVPRSHGAEAAFPRARARGAPLPQLAAARREGGGLVFSHALAHRGPRVAAAAEGGAGVSRLFGYVLGGRARAGVPADGFARLGYADAALGSFADEEVEWPRPGGADSDSDSDSGSGGGAAGDCEGGAGPR